MDWTGIAAVLAVMVSALSAVLGFWQHSYNKKQEYLLKQREEQDRLAIESERKKSKQERDAIKAASQAIYRELNRLFVRTNAMRAYIVQPHPLDKAKFISVQYEVLAEGMTSVMTQVQRLPIGNVMGFVNELQSRDFVMWHSQAEVRDGRARSMMHNFGIDKMAAMRMMDGDVWLGNVVLDFDENHPLDAVYLKTNMGEVADIIKYRLPEIED